MNPPTSYATRSGKRGISSSSRRVVWIDASAGVAGDMLLAAMLDAGAALDGVRAAVEAVVPAEVGLGCHDVTRAGLRALRLEVTSLRDDHPHRSWAEVRQRLHAAELDERVRADALAVFGLLAEAEGRVHGVAADQVHFHEVGAWDSIADVVGTCAALYSVQAGQVFVGPVALGSGHVRTAHGVLPVPVPAVLELARGRTVSAGGEGELATPTGMALLAALAPETVALPSMTVEAIGVGAGGREVDGRANVVRVVVGTLDEAGGDTARAGGSVRDAMWVLETNIDDLDPRAWPGVLSTLLERGAADAWLTPILMKKGRPAHTLSVLTHDDETRARLRDTIIESTTTLGVRETAVVRSALDRAWHTVELEGGQVRIKLGVDAGRIVQATPEFDDADRLARQRGVAVRQILREAEAEARIRGMYPSASWPTDVSAHG